VECEEIGLLLASSEMTGNHIKLDATERAIPNHE